MNEGAHHCGACGSKARVTAMSHWDGITRRVLECACGERWESVENRGKRLQPVVTGFNRLQPATTGCNPLQPVATGCSPLEPVDKKPPPEAVQPPVAERGGVGGGLPSGQVSDLVPHQGTQGNPDQTRTRSKVKANPEYPVEFEAQWEATAKTGSKFKAFEAWTRHGRPVLADGWAKWATLDGWRRGFIPHVVTWINGRCYEQEPVEPKREVVGAKPARSAGNVEVLQGWLAKGQVAT